MFKKMNQKISVLKSKIHRAVVTEAELDYFGSITIDGDLLDAANIVPYEKVLITGMNSGARLETYALRGQSGSGAICLNGPSAHLIKVDEEILIMTFTTIDSEDAKNHNPIVVFPKEKNLMFDVQILNAQKVY